VSRARRKHGPRVARYAAPAAFLLAVTIAVLLIRSGLDSGSPSTTTGPAATRPATTATATTSTRQHTTKRTTARFHTVQQGDTFGTIAAQEGISVEQLQELNPGVSSNSLQVGQRLRVK
jgi:LysM repeat protein